MAHSTNAGATNPPVDPGVPFESGEWTGTRFRIIGGPDWLAADDRYVYVRRDDQHVEVLDANSRVYGAHKLWKAATHKARIGDRP